MQPSKNYYILNSKIYGIVFKQQVLTAAETQPATPQLQECETVSRIKLLSGFLLSHTKSTGTDSRSGTVRGEPESYLLPLV